MWGGGVGSPMSNIRARGVSGQLHMLVALLLGSGTLGPIKYEAGWAPELI